MADKTKSFPKRFLWGAATAAHQVEGKNHNQWSVWELENAKTKAAQAEYHYHDLPAWDAIKADAKSPDNYVSGKLSDHYNRYEEDFGFLDKMHMNAYRFSIEWSRIEPTEGTWNPEAVAHYRDYIAALKKRNIEPVMTLLHFTLPVWFMEKGGFEHRKNIQYFVRFAERIMRDLGKGVKYVITINEPEVYGFMSYKTQEWPPNQSSSWKMWRTIRNQLTAHKRAYKAIKAVNPRFKIGIAKNSTYYYPGDTAWLSSASASVMQWLQDDYHLRTIKKSSDFLGLNYYFSDRVFGYRTHNPENADYTDLNWVVAPGDIQYVLERWHRKYKLPIMITENGLADAEDALRQEWIKTTIVAMQHAIGEGVELIGYLHWSLIDNFEWAYGKWPRFGLVAVDYKTGERTLRPSAAWFGRVIKRLRDSS
jgi:beta-glucosidase